MAVFSPTGAALTNWQESGRLVIQFTRNPNDFSLPNYVRYVPTALENGVFKYLNQNFNRTLKNQSQTVWPPGTLRPMNSVPGPNQIYTTFTTQRYNYDVPNVDDITQASALVEDVDLIAVETNGAMRQAMGYRTRRVLAAAINPVNWQQNSTTLPQNFYMLSADHTGTPESLTGGGNWSAGSYTNPYIANSLGQVRILINKDTDSVLGRNTGAWFLLVNPNTAFQIAMSPELRTALQNTPYAQQILWGEGDGWQGEKFNLPKKLYGVNIIVEDCTYLAEPNPSVTSGLNPQFVLPDGAALLIYREGKPGAAGIQGPRAMSGMAPVMSTLSMFYCTAGVAGPNTGMTEAQANLYDIRVQSLYRPWDRLTSIAADENTWETVTCAASGYYFQNVLS